MDVDVGFGSISSLLLGLISPQSKFGEFDDLHGFVILYMSLISLRSKSRMGLMNLMICMDF